MPRRYGKLSTLVFAWVLTGCSLAPDKPDSSRPARRIAGHEDLVAPETARPGNGRGGGDLADPEHTGPHPPGIAPGATGDERNDRYTLSVDRIPTHELLFALARDADIEVDIRGEIGGRVTLNAVDTSLEHILRRIALQVPIRFRFEPGRLWIEADTPYLKIYPVNYLNMARRSGGRVDLATQIGSTGAADRGTGGGNNSRTHVENQSDHRLWDSLAGNIAGILGGPADANAPGAEERIVISREAGLIAVRATDSQHQLVDSFLRRVLSSARRQVLIEATVVEVQLDDAHQAGVDWRAVSRDGEGLSLSADLLGSTLATPPAFALDFLDSDNRIGGFELTLRALSDFGRVKVLSSPKIIAMNNQTSVLKVVDNRVYFTTSVTITSASDSSSERESFETELHTVPVGLVMNVTPFVDGRGEVVLNVRPTISRILGFVDDPNPDLVEAGVSSRIPEIQVREMESLLRVDSGQTAVIGGLMQDRDEKTTVGVPLLANLPLVGALFRFESTRSVKTELLVFLRPTVFEPTRPVAPMGPDGHLPAASRWLPGDDPGASL